MFIVQINDTEGMLKELVHIGISKEGAEQRFIGACVEHFSNWDEYTESEITAILDNGYAQFGAGIILFIDTSNCITDDELKSTLMNQPSRDTTVVKIIQDGEIPLTDDMSIDEILELCCDNLDNACAWDIQGSILFKGSDGQWYTIVTESSIVVAHPEFVKDTLEDIELEKRSQ